MFSKLGCIITAMHRHFLREGLITATRRTLVAKQHSKTCWKCNHHQENTTSIFCEQCEVIQHPHETENYFNLFGIKTQYNIDVPSLQKTYHKMQTQLHPDKFANSTADEKLISAEFSSLVNDAYNTLSNPMARALHMLSIHGESILESDKSTDNEFLMQIMELNEAIENVKTAQDFRALDERNNVVLKQIEKNLSQQFVDMNIAEAKHLVIKMKYYHTLSTKIKEAMGNKGIVD